MGNSIFEKAAEFLKQQRRQHKWLSIVSALAVIVALCTVIVLIMPGQAMTDQSDCLNGAALTEEETANQEAAPEVVPAADEPAQEETPSAGDETHEVLTEDAPAAEDASVSESDPSNDSAADSPEEGTDNSAGAEAENNSPEALPDAEDGLLTQTFSNDEAIFTATYTKAANLPEDAKFIAEKQELDAKTAGEAPEGMLRYNVGFYVNGVEVEPEAPVNISIKFIKGDFADADSIKVIHYVPQGTEKIDAEANVNNEGHVETDFNLSSFSVIDIYGETAVTLADANNGTFSLIFHYTTIWDNERELKIHCVDESGQPISASGVTNIDEYSADVEYKAENFAPSIDGFELKEMRWSIAKGTVINSVTSKNYFRGFKRYAGWMHDKSTTVFESGDVYLVYTKSQSGGGSGSTTLVEPTLTHEKYVSAEKDDGTYDLTLTVSSTVGSSTSKTLMDVVIVIDKSNSMSNKVDRITPAKNAAKSLINTINDKSDVIDARFNIIEFAAPNDDSTKNTTDNSSKSYGWTNASTAKNNVNSIKVSGGTNYEAAMEQTKIQLQSARKGAQTVVVFLTDGNPTSMNGSKSGGTYDDKYLNAAINSVNNNQLQVSYFYALGIGEASDQHLRSLTNAVTASTKSTQILQSANQLESVFKAIGAQVTKIPAENVSVTDVLSENVEFTDNELTVVAKDKDGNTITVPSGITASKDADGKTFHLNFPSGYGLEDGVTYAVVANVQATQQAYDAYAENNGYPDVGEENTDAPGSGSHSSGKPGLFSNSDGSYVTYSVSGKTHTEEYPKPVIQIHPQTDTPADDPYIDVSKTFTGVDELTEAVKNSFTITVTAPDNKAYQLKLQASDGAIAPSKISEDKLSYTWHLEKLTALGNYTVKENGMEIDGYDLLSGKAGDVDVTADNASVTVSAGGVDDVKVTTDVRNCNQLTYNVGQDIGFMVCSMTDGSYIVWTKEHLSTAQRQAFITEFAKRGSGVLYSINANSIVKFFNGSTLNDKIVVKNGAGTVQYNANGSLNFSGHKIWKMFAVGTMNVPGNTNGDIHIENTYSKIILVKILKVSNENPEAVLEGASFEVSGPAGFTETTWTSDGNGSLWEGQLKEGTYTLTETKAPAGYLLSDKVVSISISNGSSPVTAGMGEGADYVSLTVTSEQNDQGQTVYKICIPNSAGVEMPHTGGSGNRTMMCGIAILLGGMLYGIVIMRRRRVSDK